MLIKAVNQDDCPTNGPTVSSVTQGCLFQERDSAVSLCPSQPENKEGSTSVAILEPPGQHLKVSSCHSGGHNSTLKK